MPAFVSSASRGRRKSKRSSSRSSPSCGAKGAYALEKVTRQLVEDELIAFVARVVAS
jgi:hypothetical protein